MTDFPYIFKNIEKNINIFFCRGSSHTIPSIHLIMIWFQLMKQDQIHFMIKINRIMLRMLHSISEEVWEIITMTGEWSILMEFNEDKYILCGQIMHHISKLKKSMKLIQIIHLFFQRTEEFFDFRSWIFFPKSEILKI